MYHIERMKKATVLDNEGIKRLKLNLLRTLFAYRVEEGLDDTAIIQKIIDDDYISIEEILAEKSNLRIASEFLSPFYSNIINAVTKKMVENSNIKDILFNYFFNIYLPDIKTKSGKANLKIIISKFKKGQLKGANACFIAYLLLEENEDKFLIRDLCHKQMLINPLYNVEQCSLVETVSDFLECDLKKERIFSNRFLIKRETELFNYICKKAGVNTEGYTDDEKYTAICAAAFGITSSNLYDYSKYKRLVDTGLFQPADIGIGNELSLQYIGPLNKIGYSSSTVIASKLLKSEFGQLHCQKNLTATIIANGNNKEFVDSAIWEYLLDNITDSYYAMDKDKIMKEQIIRQFTYSDNDCKIVLEKIAAAIQFYVLANYTSKVIDKSIDYGDYSNIKSSIQREISVNKSKNIEAQKTAKKIDKLNVSQLQSAKNELEREKEFSKRLENENENLHEQIDALKNQITRDSDKNKIIDELRDSNEILNDENELLRSQLNLLREKYNRIKNHQTDEVSSVDSVVSDFDDTYFREKKFIIVGGRWEINRELLELMPKSKVVYNPTDNLIDVRKYDAVIFFTDFLSHTLYRKYINQCRLYNSPILYLKGSSIENIKNGIYAFTSDSNDNKCKNDRANGLT